MSSDKDRGHEPEMRDEYDFSGGVRGKYASRFAKGSNVIVLGFTGSIQGIENGTCLGVRREFSGQPPSSDQAMLDCLASRPWALR